MGARRGRGRDPGARGVQGLAQMDQSVRCFHYFRGSSLVLEAWKLTISRLAVSLLRPNGAMDVLADASLAAEIEGRTQVTGLDPTFRLSSITHALEAPDEGAPKAPLAPILSKGIVDVDTAVELFRM